MKEAEARKLKVGEAVRIKVGGQWCHGKVDTANAEIVAIKWSNGNINRLLHTSLHGIERGGSDDSAR